MPLKDSEKIDRGIRVMFDLKTGTLQAYDPEHAIFFDLRLLLECSPRYTTRFLFKGMRVEFPYWRRMPLSCINSCHGIVEFNGFSAREYLTLNREKIRDEKIDEISKLLNDDIHLLLKFCYKRLKDCMEEENIPQKVWGSFACLYTFFLNQQQDLMEDCREKILKNVDKKIKVYQFEKGQGIYQEKDISLGNCLKTIWGGEAFFVFDTHRAEISMSASFSVDAMLKISEHIADKPDIIHQKSIIENAVLLREFNLLNIYSDSQYKKCYIYEYQYKNGDIRLPKIREDAIQEYRKEILQRPRMASMACDISDDNTYNRLLTKNVPNLIWLSHDRYFHWTHELANLYYIITPFIKEDIEHIDSGASSDEIWHQIEYREDFKNLVEYVQKNNIDADLSEDDIRHAYKQWIADILDFGKM